MQLVFGHDVTVWQWANKYFETPLPKPTWAIGIIDKGGTLQGALIGEERSESTVEVTICATGAITHNVAKWFFKVVFERYWRVEIRTTKDNKTVKRNAPKWGFSFEGTAKDYWGPGKSALLYRMLRNDCRWLKQKQPQELIDG